MRWTVYIPFGLVLAGVVILAYLLNFERPGTGSSAPSAQLNDELPPFELTSLLEPEQTLVNRNLYGEPFLLNVWGSWCPSCRIEHPMLNKLAEQGVPIVGLNYRDSRDGGQKWLADRGNPYTVNLFDPRGEFGFELGVVGAPETYVIDRNGVVRYRHVGILNDRHWNGSVGEAYRDL